jgi:Na+-transporting NADH:ubiquinone oxidoreductase subunit NqrF
MALIARLPARPLFIRTGIITVNFPQKPSKELAFMDNDGLYSLLTSKECLPRKGTCLGNKQCAHCAIHIVKGPKLPRTLAERILLGDAPETTHLACDIKLTKDFDGAIVTVEA